MPRIMSVDPNTVELLPESKSEVREPYLVALRTLRDNKQPILFAPGENETLRKLRVNITRAANDLEMGDIVTHRETKDGNLFVYLKPVSAKRARKTKAQEAEDSEGEGAVE